jgi:5'-nucleotidase
LRILLTNDDGITAAGINAAALALTKAGHQVVCSAPEAQRSGSSHSVTLRRPMTVRKIKMPAGFEGYAVSGSPADACRMGFTLFHDPGIDLVISGINDDTNLAYDINYSGTVGAALEAAAAGYPALAASIEGEEPYDWEGAGAILERAATSYAAWGIPAGAAVNLNIPQKISSPEFVWCAPHRATPYDYIDQRRLDEDTLECTRHREKGEKLTPQETDVWHFTQGRITLSPIIPAGVCLETLVRLSGKDPSLYTAL